MMHVISIPYALMKVNPLSWIQKVCQYKGRHSHTLTHTHDLIVRETPAGCSQKHLFFSPAAKVACVKSRDMHWALVAHRDQRDVNLSSLRMLVVADGSNPCKN